LHYHTNRELVVFDKVPDEGVEVDHYGLIKNCNNFVFLSEHLKYLKK
jgi:hypothetical protein